MTKKRPCGTCLVINHKTQLTDVLTCILDQTPRHTFHLLMDPKAAQEMGVEARAAAIAKFIGMPDPTKPKRPARVRGKSAG